MPEILRVDLAARTFHRDPVRAAWVGLGGRGLTSAIVAAEVPADADPLGPENKLILAPGVLAATSVPNSGRLSVGGKSPLTGTIKESNVGGSVAQKLARLGIAAVVLEGVALEPVRLVITKDGVAFKSAGGLWGKGNYDAIASLKGEYVGAGFVTVGPAGEKRLKASAVCVTTPDYLPRTAARGGLGAVMGSKNVKALVVDDAGAPGVEVADPERFKAASRALAEGIAAHPLIGGFQALGTSMLVGLINEFGALPTRNFSAGQFEGAVKISGETLAGVIAGRKGASPKHHCMAGCIVWCSQVVTDEAGEILTSGFEYETLGLVGSNCAIDDLNQIARIDRLCDDLGLDTMEVGAAVGVAMEANKLEWGDAAGVIRALESIRRDDAFGKLLASGCSAVGKTYGVSRVPAVKGQSLSGYDPRVLKGTGATYATCPMGADHTAGNVLPSPANPEYNPTNPEGQAHVSEFAQSYFATIDSLGVCLFASLPVVESPYLQAKLAEAVSAKLGQELPPDYLISLGGKVCRVEKDFNRRAGFGPADDRLPSFFAEEALAPHGGRWDVKDADLDAMFA